MIIQRIHNQQLSKPQSHTKMGTISHNKTGVSVSPSPNIVVFNFFFCRKHFPNGQGGVLSV